MPQTSFEGMEIKEMLEEGRCSPRTLVGNQTEKWCKENLDRDFIGKCGVWTIRNSDNLCCLQLEYHVESPATSRSSICLSYWVISRANTGSSASRNYCSADITSDIDHYYYDHSTTKCRCRALKQPSSIKASCRGGPKGSYFGRVFVNAGRV